MDLIVTPTFSYVTGRIPMDVTAALVHALRYRDDSYIHSPVYRHRFQRAAKRNDAGDCCTCGRSMAGDSTDTCKTCRGRFHVVGPCNAGSTHGADHQCRTCHRLTNTWVPLMTVQGGQLAFPTGLLHRVRPLLPPYVVEHPQGPMPKLPAHRPSPLPDGTQLYEDQVAAVQTVREHTRGLFNLATNFGKLELIAGLCYAYADARVLVIVDGKTPLLDNQKRLEERLRETVGLYGGGVRTAALRTRVQVATIQTLHANVKTPAVQTYLKSVDVLLVDEGDTVTVKQWFPVLGTCTAPVRVSMSGSMRDAPHALVVEAFFGPILMEVRDAQLVAQGRSARPTILMPQVGAMLPETRDYDELYGPGIVHNHARNQIFVEAAEILARYGLRTLGLYYWLEHGRVVQQAMRARGLRVECVQGDSPPHVRQQALKDLAERRLDVVLGSNIFVRQVNAPFVEAVFNLAGWRSARATGQKDGRGLRRKTEGANRVLILDPYDMGNGLLRGHSDDRERTHARKGGHVQRGPWEVLRPLVDGFCALHRAAPAPSHGVARTPMGLAKG